MQPAAGHVEQDLLGQALDTANLLVDPHHLQRAQRDPRGHGLLPTDDAHHRAVEGQAADLDQDPPLPRLLDRRRLVRRQRAAPARPAEDQPRRHLYAKTHPPSLPPKDRIANPL